MNNKYMEFCNKKIKDPSYYVEIDKDLCDKKINILLGPNGCGKTLSLRNIEDLCKKENTICLKYSNKQNDIVNNWSEFNKNSDISDLACAFHSEGERIIDSVDKWAGNNLVKELLEHDKDVWVLFDELDSGLSIDKLYYFLEQITLIQAMEKDKNPDRTVRLIFTANSFELLDFFKHFKDVKYIFVPTNEEIPFEEIQEYDKFRQLYIDYYKYMQNSIEEE